MVGGVFFILLNLFLFSYFFKTYQSFTGDISSKQSQAKTLAIAISDAGDWQQKTSWITAHQPKLKAADESLQGAELLRKVVDLATRHGIVVKNQRVTALEVPGKNGNDPKARASAPYLALPVEVEFSSAPKELVAFLYELQGPEQFMVVEHAELKVDNDDKTRMTAQLKIAKWFAPG